MVFWNREPLTKGHSSRWGRIGCSSPGFISSSFFFFSSSFFSEWLANTKLCLAWTWNMSFSCDFHHGILSALSLIFKEGVHRAICATGKGNAIKFSLLSRYLKHALLNSSFCRGYIFITGNNEGHYFKEPTMKPLKPRSALATKHELARVNEIHHFKCYNAMVLFITSNKLNCCISGKNSFLERKRWCRNPVTKPAACGILGQWSLLCIGHWCKVTLRRAFYHCFCLSEGGPWVYTTPARQQVHQGGPQYWVSRAMTEWAQWDGSWAPRPHPCSDTSE